MTDESWTGSNVGYGEPRGAEAAPSERATPQDMKPRAARGRMGLTAAAMAAGGVAFLTSGADAQDVSDVPEGYEAASDVANVASIHVQADGSVELVMADGQTIIIAAADVVVEDGIVYLSTASVDAALDAAITVPASGGGGAAILGLVAAGGGLAAAAGGGGGGSSTPAPTPVTNTNPPVFTSSTSASVDENSSGTAYTATATDADGNSISYSIVGGSDAADFSINATTGAVTFVGSPDFENPDDSNTDNAYEVIIRASDGTNTTDQTVTISVNDVDEAPVFLSPASASVTENQTSAYDAVAADDEGTTLTYALSGTDAALFTIDANTGVVTFKTAPDHENSADAGGDNVYDIVVSASDGTNTTDQAVAITVTDQNDNVPVFTSSSSVSVAENQISAFTAVATDADASDTVTYSLSGADAAGFKINAATGAVTFVTAPDYETPGDQSFEVVVTASDGTNTTDQTVTISVTDVNEAPVFTSAATASVQENQTAAYTAAASDPDLTSPTYSISGGADASLFNINATTGEVTFKVAPDFETPGDAGGNNVYDIVVRASDGSNNVDQAVAITVTDANDNAPIFSSSATASVAEGTLTAYDADASDADASDTIAYSISGTDAALFNINSSTGVVTFKVAPDFEAPADAGANNVYDITVTASDGLNSSNQAVAITVTNASENAPVFTSPGTASAPENGTAAYTAVATDVDSDPITYSIAGGVDATLFAIDPTSGVVTFVSAPDHESPADSGGDNVYDIIVRASDGTNNTDQAIAISVTDLNDNAPVFTSGAAASVAENQTSAYDANATDADAGSTLSYSISGTDSGLFSIDSSTGVVTFLSAPDFEAPTDSGGNNVYDFVVTASDGTNTTDQTVAVTVTDLTENGDLPADATTTATLALGGTFSNQLEVVGDRDWIAVELVAGQRYAISLDGSGGDPLSDPLVRLYDATGTLIAENDDGGPGLNSLLTYTVATTGTYYVEAAAWDDTVAGSYTVGLETAAPLEEYTNDQIAEFLRSGYWTGNGSTARNWNVTDGGTITVSLVGLTADGQTLARAALGLWSDLTGINFSEVTVGGQMVFDDNEEGASSATSTSGGFIVSAEVNVSTDWVDTYGTNLDSYSFQTYIHEIGHSLGLGHSGPYNGSADYAVDAAYLNDSWQASVMSYFSQTENTYIDASFAFVVSPQVADVLAVQTMYGLAANIRAGDTVYGFNSTAGNAIYDATSFTTVTSYTIVDTGGTDTMDYSGSAANQTLDLRAESFSSVQGGRGNVSIARGTVIENATGGSGNDTLIGNSANNALTGNGGNDRFFASGGTDVYDGGAGSDTVVFSGLQTDYAISTNGAGHTVVTDLRVGTPDGVTELISIETIEYGTSAPSLMEPLSPKSVSDSLVQDRLSGADWAAMGVNHDGNFRGVIPGVFWGLEGLQLLDGGGAEAPPVMRPLDLAELGQSIPVVGLGIEGDKAGAAVMDVLDNSDALSGALVIDTLDMTGKPSADIDVMPDLSPEDRAQVQSVDGPEAGFATPVIESLEMAEKPVEHGDVMPELSPEDMAQIQLVDGPEAGVGTLLTEPANFTLDQSAMVGSDAAATMAEIADWNLPTPEWSADGFLALTQESPAASSPYQAAPIVEIIDGPMIVDAIDPDDASLHSVPVHAADGWM